MKISNGVKFSPRLKIGIIIVFLIAFFTALNYPPINKEVKNFFYLVSSPLQKTLWGTGDRASDFFETVLEIKNFKKEVDEHSFIDALRCAWANEELRLKIEALLAENAELRELKKENETLRIALGLGLEKEFKLLLAEVIGKDISQDTILINLGLKDGISKSLPVINQQKALVGKIGEVYSNFSKVILISNKESSFDAKIPESDIQAVAMGKGNGKLFFDLVPKEKEIKEGDLVVTTALGGIFPSGLLVGEIEKVFRSDVEAFQQAEIKPAFDIGELEILFVIVNP
jgi:rod shape-determining protein MreC